MVFSSQFSLSLELTQIVPVSLIASKAAEAVMSLARDLQSSGSDIVVEEDLARLFGTIKIEHKVASSFRTVVANSGGSRPLVERISLEVGPGPTVSRSLAPGQPAYFATVLQCSLLTSVHEKSSLASAIAFSMEKYDEAAPADHKTRAIPNQESILGVLRACEEQTSSYDWLGQIEAVALQLGFGEADISDPLAPAILRGALLLLPMVQTLPLDRKIIATMSQGDGVCIFVVWAHHVCGLDVLVKLPEDDFYEEDITEIRFGSGDAQVIIEYGLLHNTDAGASMTLLDVTNEEKLFVFCTEEDEQVIDATVKRPAKGIGKRWLERTWESFVGPSLHDPSVGKDAGILEVMKISVAYAQLLAQRSAKTCLSTPSGGTFDSGQPEAETADISSKETDLKHASLFILAQNEDGLTDCDISSSRIHEAARFLFDERRITAKTVKPYELMYSGMSLSDAPVQRDISTMSDTAGFPLDDWQHTLLPCARNLCALILAFAHVSDLEAAAGFPLVDRSDLLDDISFVNQIWAWDGKSQITVHEMQWYELVVAMTIGHTDKMDPTFLERTALVSDRGWSVFLSTFGDADPSFIESGQLSIMPGVPSRNGVRKHMIIDGPVNSINDVRIQGLSIDQTGSAALSLRREVVSFGKPLCGERGDSFIVSLRFIIVRNRHRSSRRTGYREMYGALWMAQQSQNCPHATVEIEDTELSPDSGAVAIQGDDDPLQREEKVVIYRTAHSTAARWWALATIGTHFRHSKRRYRIGLPAVLLRRKSCCLQCVLAQATIDHPQCLVVL